VKMSLFYGDVKFSTFTQNEAYNVITLLSKTSINVLTTHACSML